jgi:DNA polymerase V
MINAGIFPNDILVVDKSVKAESGNVVIAIIDGELTVKRYIKKKSSVILQPENEDYEPIELNGKSEAQIWGVVTSVIHDL